MKEVDASPFGGIFKDEAGLLVTDRQEDGLVSFMAILALTASSVLFLMVMLCE